MPYYSQAYHTSESLAIQYKPVLKNPLNIRIKIIRYVSLYKMENFNIEHLLVMMTFGKFWQRLKSGVPNT